MSLRRWKIAGWKYNISIRRIRYEFQNKRNLKNSLPFRHPFDLYRPNVYIYIYSYSENWILVMSDEREASMWESIFVCVASACELRKVLAFSFAGPILDTICTYISVITLRWLFIIPLYSIRNFIYVYVFCRKFRSESLASFANFIAFKLKMAIESPNA